MKLIDLTGQRYGNLIVLHRGENTKSNSTRWYCKCDCGNQTLVCQQNLKNGHTTSCGCKESYITQRGVGYYYPRIRRIWKNMIKRCNNPLEKNYGGKGIKVCKEWEESLDSFCEWALANGYSDQLTIDRINVDGNYEPSNCRWITQYEQSRNTTRNVNITYNNETHVLSDWSKITGIHRNTLDYRIFKQGWSIEKAFNTPPKKMYKNSKATV